MVKDGFDSRPAHEANRKKEDNAGFQPCKAE